MIKPSIPRNEAERLAELHALALLDTPQEERFDRITRTAARVFGVQTALVSLVDDDRQWFKSAVCLDATETSRDVSFCGHAINAEGPLVVPDALEDVRFEDNPLVVGGPGVRFYAGHPVKGPNGLPIGTLCLLDPAPREFSAADRALLADLAGMVEAEFQRGTLSEAVVRQLAALQALNGDLAAANAHKDEFLAVISHELRTPLNFIIGSASTLEDEVLGPINDQQAKAVARILTGADRMMRQVEDLLDVAQMQAGRLVLNLRPVAVGPLVAEVATQAAPEAARKGLALAVEADAAGTLTMDPDRFEQVLTNLVSNALKFTMEGGVTIRARMTDLGGVRVEVADTGPGISAADQAALFERFTQVDMSLTRAQNGAGLGLAIVRALVEAHEGAFGVTSSEAGSTFWFELPCARAGRREAPVLPPVPAPVPADDAARVASLRALDLLNSPPDPRFDRLTRLAQRHFGVSVAAVSLVDADRLWHLSASGAPRGEMGRDTGFCSHAVGAAGPLVVPDTRLDPRFAGNPLVVGDPNVRFYAGEPIAAPDGHLVGALCVFDPRPRTFSEANRADLAAFARLVEQELTRG